MTKLLGEHPDDIKVVKDVLREGDPELVAPALLHLRQIGLLRESGVNVTALSDIDVTRPR